MAIYMAEAILHCSIASSTTSAVKVLARRPRSRPEHGCFKTGTARRLHREAAMAWLVLFFAGLFEVVWATAMKMSEGFTKAVPTGIMVAAMLLSFILLAWSMRVLPLGTAYTIWTGIGALGAFIVGVAVFGEPLGFLRIFAALLIVSGLVLMKLATPG
ncbi:multidrug transporter EmrE-like cation transporter [Altererythrobacter atlanticus]|nr:multidrug transporter EmrE-like cation transporter [Croceibacterium atlanticum]